MKLKNNEKERHLKRHKEHDMIPFAVLAISCAIVLFRTSFSKPVSSSVLPILSSSRFNVSVLSFRSLIHFHFYLVYGER